MEIVLLFCCRSAIAVSQTRQVQLCYKTESFPKGIQGALPDGDHRAARSWDKLYVLASSADLKVLQCLQLCVVHPHLSLTTAIYCHLWFCLFVFLLSKWF